jgi:hypothetical protein
VSEMMPILNATDDKPPPNVTERLSRAPHLILPHGHRIDECEEAVGRQRRDRRSRPLESSGLPGAARRTIDLAGGEAGVGCRKLHVDRSKLRGLAGASQWGLAAELLQLLH